MKNKKKLADPVGGGVLGIPSFGPFFFFYNFMQFLGKRFPK